MYFNVNVINLKICIVLLQNTKTNLHYIENYFYIANFNCTKVPFFVIKFTVILFAVSFLSLEKIPLSGPCTPKIENKFCKIKDNLDPTEN